MTNELPDGLAERVARLEATIKEMDKRLSERADAQREAVDKAFGELMRWEKALVEAAREARRLALAAMSLLVGALLAVASFAAVIWRR